MEETPGANDRSGATSDSPIELTRRTVLKTTAGLSVAALGLGTGVTTSVRGNVDEFERLTVDESAGVIQDESGNPVRLRGVAIPDPKRLHRTRYLRGKTPIQLVQLLTDNDEGWYPRVIRVPAQPQDIGEHPMGHTGPEYESGELANPGAVGSDRRKMRPPQPVAFTQAELDDYLETYYDDVVDECEARGVYCVVDYHRHWHEQPPGEEFPRFGENHLPYDSEYTNYWAYNSHDAFGTDAPASWGWVENVTTNELTPGCEGWDCVEDESDIPGTPYAFEHWTVNEELLEEVLTFWETVADRYADRKHVLFQPYNEPAAPGIWGPVEGCGAFRQKPLWDTYVDEFMGPIIEEIRNHQPEGVLLTGVPGWSQSLQGLHWRDFTDAGYSDIAVTWHNYAGHDVSQVHNWFNDTTYQSVDEVEAETGEELDDPSLPLQSSLVDVEAEACYGWEPYEAAGLQEAYEFHPVVVSEFGWNDDSRIDRSLRGTRSGYGEPFLEHLEDDRISWIAWCGDVRWLPTLFEYPDGPDPGEVDDVLVNGNVYDTPMAALPRPCPDVEDQPCEWELLDGEDSGEYVRARLEERAADDFVPFNLTETTGQPASDGGDDGCGEDEIAIDDGEYCAAPSGDDGLYRDVDGSGTITNNDVIVFFEHFEESTAMQATVEAFDFAGSGSLTTSDVVALFETI